MTASITTNFVVAAALAVAALSAASAAHARSEVQFSIGIGIPSLYMQPGPVYVQPRLVYVQPAPVYAQPRTVYVQSAPFYSQPAPIYLQPAPHGYHYEHGRDWRREQWERRYFRHHHGGDRGNGRNWD